MAETNSSTKACTWCEVAQPPENFTNDKNRKDGKHPHCKKCTKERMAELYKRTKEVRSANAKAQYEKNKEKYLTQAKKWAAENKEKRREISRNYVANNPEKRRATQTRNRLQNPGLYAAHYKARQQRKRKAMPAWANEENIKAIYRQCAWVSRITGIKHHVDHYYPLKSDSVCGLHNEFNLRIIPAFDNLSKGNRVLQ